MASHQSEGTRLFCLVQHLAAALSPTCSCVSSDYRQSYSQPLCMTHLTLPVLKCWYLAAISSLAESIQAHRKNLLAQEQFHTFPNPQHHLNRPHLQLLTSHLYSPLSSTSHALFLVLIWNPGFRVCQESILSHIQTIQLYFSLPTRHLSWWFFNITFTAYKTKSLSFLTSSGPMHCTTICSLTN